MGCILPELRAREVAHRKTLGSRIGRGHGCGPFGSRAVGRGPRRRGCGSAVAPVFPTSSHADRLSLGAARFRLMAARSVLPVYALGGVNGANAQSLSVRGVVGLAAIDGRLLVDQRR